MCRNSAGRTKKVDWESVGLAFSVHSKEDGHPLRWPEGLCECKVFTAGLCWAWWDENLPVPTGFVARCVSSAEQGSFKAGSMLDIALPRAVYETAVQDTQFETAVCFNVVHIVFCIRFCTYLLHTSSMQSNVIARRLFCYWLLDPGKKQNSPCHESLSICSHKLYGATWLAVTEL